jgi:hypothetical protein
VVVLEDELPWPEAEEAIDMAEVTTALATAVAVEPERPPVREAALAEEDMVRLGGFAGVGGVDVGDDDCRPLSDKDSLSYLSMRYI